MIFISYRRAETDDHAGARALQESVLGTRRRVLGEEHPGTIGSAWNLFLTHLDLADPVAASSVFDSCLKPLLLRDPETLSADLRHIRQQLLDNREDIEHRAGILFPVRGEAP